MVEMSADYRQRISLIEDYQVSTSGEILFVTAFSYEERAFESLKRAVGKFNIGRVFIFEFNVEDYLDEKVLGIWYTEREKVLGFLSANRIDYRVQNTQDRDFGDSFTCLFNELKEGLVPVIDISTLPKNYILKSALTLDKFRPAFQYTRSVTDIPSKDQLKVGVSKIIPVDGFEGDIDVNAETLLILVLGFEGNRALAFLNEFQPDIFMALIGTPGCGKDDSDVEKDRYYREQARKNNVHLLKNSYVKEAEVNSLDHKLFAEQLSSIVENNVILDRPTNKVISSIGTKIQTLGLYLYWKKHPETQILYTVPNRRPLLSQGIGGTFIYTLP